ncbi:MAG: acetyl-CoA carboxylase biotin carboxyl carrier protein subunit [bacterium]
MNIELDSREHTVDVTQIQGNQCRCNIDGKEYIVDFCLIKSDNNLKVYSIISEGKSYEVILFRSKEFDTVYVNGNQYTVRLGNHLGFNKKKEKKLHEDKGVFHISATIPGKIIAVKVNSGAIVKKGEPLVVIEAMKMENELRSPTDGKITNVYVKAGDKVESNAPLIDVDSRLD